MITHISKKFSAYALLCMLAFLAVLPVASAHNGEVHAEDTAKITQLKQMITILTEVVELLKMKAALPVKTDHHDGSDSDELKVTVEVHSYKTHAHVQKEGKAEEAFILEGIDYTDEEAVIEAIAKKTGLSVHAIEEVITFPEGKLDAKGDSVHAHNEDSEQDESGIHIMNDGTIMWGNGTKVSGATVTQDGKVKLSDGDIITPAFDLR